MNKEDVIYMAVAVILWFSLSVYFWIILTD